MTLLDREAHADHRHWQANEHWPITAADVADPADEYLRLATEHEIAEVVYGYGSPQEQAASDAIDRLLGITTPVPCCCAWDTGRICTECPDHTRWATGWDCGIHGGVAA